MNNVDQLKYNLVFETEKFFANLCAKNEPENENTQNYLNGLITPYEYLVTTKMSSEFI